MKKRKRPKIKRVAPTRLISTTTEIVKSIVNRPAWKNMVLTIIAVALCAKFKINEISRHLPVAVQTERTKRKPFFRFIDSKFPKQQALDRWARFMIATIYQTSGAVVPILIAETALIAPF